MRRFTEETYKGDVQIAAKATLWDVIELFKNIDREDLEKATKIMYVQTLNQMSHIRATIGVSRELDRYLKRLQEKDLNNKMLECSIGFDTLQKEGLIDLNQVEYKQQTLSANLMCQTTKENSFLQFAVKESSKSVE